MPVTALCRERELSLPQIPAQGCAEVGNVYVLVGEASLEVLCKFVVVDSVEESVCAEGEVGKVEVRSSARRTGAGQVGQIKD